ncbi:MAG: PQQ-binding-like beta-propeller repeat protein [Phycisphaerae bacterium]
MLKTLDAECGKRAEPVCHAVRTGAGGTSRATIVAMLTLWPILVTLACGGPPAPAPAGAQPKAGARGVYLDDSFEAVDAILEARRLARRGRWRDAAQRLQDTSDKYGTKLVRVGPGHYTGLRGHVADLIAAWPPPGIAAYRALVEGRMQRGVEAARSARETFGLDVIAPEAFGRNAARGLPRTDGLLALFNRYFCTAGAASLADRIGQRAIESGDFALAEHVYRRVLERHPDRERYTKPYGAMLRVLSALRGQARDVLGPDATMSWMGQQRPVSDVITEITAEFTPATGTGRPDDWPMFGGSRWRSRIGPSSVDQLGLLWHFDAFGDRARDAGGAIEGSRGRSGDRAGRLVLNPVVAGGRVFVQRHREIVALDLRTGIVAWRFGAPEPGDGVAADFDDTQVPGWYAVTVEDGHVYATLTPGTSSYFGFTKPGGSVELICLAASDGRVVWRTTPTPPDAQGEKDMTLDSAPLVRHGTVYVIGRRARSFGFEDGYLYAFDADDAALKFRTHLGSASTGTFGSRRATTAIVASHADTIYACTNVGTVAAVSAHTGAVRWLRLYERAAQRDGDSPLRSRRDAKPWHYNPVMIVSSGHAAADHRVICLPNDSDHLLVLSATDGHVLQAIPTSAIGGMRTVLGVRDDVLCGVGDRVACVDLSDRHVIWDAALPIGGEAFGRGTWVRSNTDAGDRLLVPTRQGLSMFNVTNGTRSDLTWGTEAEGGNILALPDRMLVAGVDRIEAYVRKAEIFAALRQRMADAPFDPEPAVELAEVAFRAEEFREALTVLDEAVRRAAAPAAGVGEQLKRRMFDDTLEFARVLATRHALADDVCDTLCAYASRFAPDEPAHVRYRLAFAERFEGHGNVARAVRLYQQILRDRSLRGVPLDNRAGDAAAAATSPASPDLAGLAAQKRIAALIERHGRDIYDPFEAEAQRWLASGRAARDAATLARVVDTFPNAKAAPDALVALGERHTESGDHDAAARQFAAAYQRYPDYDDRPGLIRLIADAYERAGKVEQAYRWLTKGARAHPTATLRDHGRTLTLLEYRRRLAGIRDKVDPSRPDIEPPLDRRATHAVDVEATLLTPRFAGAPGGSWSRYYVLDAGTIRAFDARTGAERWPDPPKVRASTQLLVATDDLAVFANAYQVFALDATTAAQRWSYGEYPPAAENPGADWEHTGVIRGHALHAGRLLTVRDDGRFTCVSIQDGAPVWWAMQEVIPQGTIALSDRWVAFTIVQDGTAVLCLLNADTGRWIDAIRTGERRPIRDIHVTLDEQIILVTSQSAASYDAQRRELRWEVGFGGHVGDGAVLIDLDAMYVAPDGRHVRKLSLENASVLWRSEPVAPRGDGPLTLDLQRGSLLVSTPTAVRAIDAATGLTLWDGATPPDPRFVRRLVGDAYLLAVDIPERDAEHGGLDPRRDKDEPPDPDRDAAGAIFYDVRNASGVIPRDGGRCRLGPLADVKTIMAVDGALLVQTGTTIRRFAHE